MRYEELFVNPFGRTARGPYVGALLVLLAAFAFYWFLVPGRTGKFRDAGHALPGPRTACAAAPRHGPGRAGRCCCRAPCWPPPAGFHLYAPEAAATRPVALTAAIAAALLICWALAGKERAAPEPG
jgi:hypothetical protein